MPGLPPLPQDIGAQPDPSQGGGAPQGGGSPTAFTGGLPALQQSMQQAEAGLAGIAKALPSLSPMVAQWMSQLRQIIPSAMSAAAGPPAAAGNPTLPGSAQGLPSPPMGPPNA